MSLKPGATKADNTLPVGEICYNVDDILPMCEELDLPLVVSSTVCNKSRKIEGDVSSTITTIGYM
jgi:UV DNA damage repair endonuclease